MTFNQLRQSLTILALYVPENDDQFCHNQLADEQWVISIELEKLVLEKHKGVLEGWGWDFEDGRAIYKIW
ncbi:MAG: hypothetical protein HC878_00150 [Leptolyngbyaceae cyanobacterium SL_5_14]|nr:hypothetical protein [Leptolyngbyaceae cyanobacterium SL_5_14]